MEVFVESVRNDNQIVFDVSLVLGLFSIYLMLSYPCYYIEFESGIFKWFTIVLWYF